MVKDTVVAIVKESGHPAQWESWLSAINQVGITVATIVGIIAGIYGIRAWRRQLQGTHEFEVAKGSLKAFINLRDQIEKLRNPMKGIGEIAEVLERNGVRVESFRDFINLSIDKYIYPKRWQELHGVWSTSRDFKVDSEVIWGDKIKVQIEQVDSIVRRIGAAIDSHVRFSDQPGWTTNASYLAIKGYFEATFYPENSDEFGKEVDRVFKGVERFYRGIIQDESLFSKVLNWIREKWKGWSRD
jgi:hypothetical protein